MPRFSRVAVSYAKDIEDTEWLDADPTVAFFNTESWAARNDVLLDHPNCLIHYGNMSP
jgi:hypothetical protein